MLRFSPIRSLTHLTNSRMDPASAFQVAAGAAQFVGLAAKGFLELYHYSSKVKNAPKLSREVQDCAYMLSSILNELHSAVEATNPRPTELTNTLNDIVVDFSQIMKEWRIKLC